MDRSFGGEGIGKILRASGQRLLAQMNPLSKMVRGVGIFCCMSKTCPNNIWWHIQRSVFQQQCICSSLGYCHNIS